MNVPKVQETLAVLMTATGLANPQVAEAFANSLEPAVAERLLESLRNTTVGDSPNLPEGKGGFLAGLRLTLDSFIIAQKSTLGGNPKKLNSAERLKRIEAYDKRVAESNADLVSGIRQILAANRAKRKSDLAVWSVELSDEDKPVALAKLDKDQKAREEEALKALDATLKKGRTEAKAIVKRHKNH